MKRTTTDSEHLQWFRNAAPYINLHRGRTFVLYFSGEALNSEDTSELFHDLALLSSLGIRLVLVHGARPQVDRACKQQQIDIQIKNGVRVTTEQHLPLVIAATGATRIAIEAQLSYSLPNTPMSGSRLRIASGNFVTAQPWGVEEGIDFQHTGTVRRIDSNAINAQLNLGNLVLLSPLGYSPTGEIFNLLAEQVATEAAIALRADKLIILMEEDQLRNTRKQIIANLDPAAAEQLVTTGKRKLSADACTHLMSAVKACRHGVSRNHLISRREVGGLLRELFTRAGAGTLVSAEPPDTPRPATIDDVSSILELIKPLEESGVLVRRSREQLELEIANFWVIEKENTLIACAAFYPYPQEELAELACVAVDEDYAGDNRGDQLLDALEIQAKASGIKGIFVLTTHTAHWFRERSFAASDLDDLPMKKRELYNYQRNSKVFLKRL